jgi:hypothetical protein
MTLTLVNNQQNSPHHIDTQYNGNHHNDTAWQYKMQHTALTTSSIMAFS